MGESSRRRNHSQDFKGLVPYGWNLGIRSFKDTEVREASFQHLANIFESTSLAPQIKWKIIRGLLNEVNDIDDQYIFADDEPSTVYEIMGLHDQHPLMQLAIQTASICDPDALKNSNNPYRVYREIKHVLAKEPMIESPIYNISGIEVSLNIQKLREKNNWAGYKAKDLPQGITPNILKDLFQSLDNRLDGMENSEDILEEIKNMCGMSYDNLKINFLERSFITGLLRKDNGPEEFISPSKFHLFAALRAILDQSDSIADGKKLSPREEMLLKMSASAQNCNIGIRDGLANYYNLLPQKYQSGSQAQMETISEAEKLVDKSVQSSLQAVFSDVSLLLSLGGESMKSQLAHASLYLKNRYHKQVGLQHQLTFDEHTGVLSDQLLNQKHDNVLNQIFGQCNPFFLAKRLIIDSEQAFKDRLFVGLMNLIGKVEGEEAYRRYCVFDDETYEPIRLTETGALAILKATGYFVNA